MYLLGDGSKSVFDNMSKKKKKCVWFLYIQFQVMFRGFKNIHLH